MRTPIVNKPWHRVDNASAIPQEDRPISDCGFGLSSAKEIHAAQGKSGEERPQNRAETVQRGRSGDQAENKDCGKEIASTQVPWDI